VRRLRFLPPAEAEVLAAVAHYEEAKPGLGADFLAELERAMRRIVAFAEHGTPFIDGTRRVLLTRFPFGIVYSDDGDELLVVAVPHQRRMPGYWRGRLMSYGG
jgi:plasmid stabilization system protein ParE